VDAARRAEAFEGAILGLAIGDALGYPAEFRRRAQILEAFGPDGLTGFVRVHDPAWPPKPWIVGADHPPGTFTDDTQMSLALAEALISAGHEPLDALMEEVGRRFVAWSRSPDNNRAPGNACMTGCRNLARGVPWREAGVPDSKGCGTAMRVAPIGLCYADDLDRLLEVARASALPTHGHDAGVEGAAAAALMVALAMGGASPEEIYREIRSRCGGRSADFDASMARLPNWIERAPEEALCKRGLGEGWVAEEAVASALYCFWRAPDDFARCTLTAANTDGDSDSIACIAGGVAGAALGAAAIPVEWRSEVERAEELREVAARLLDAAA